MCHRGTTGLPWSFIFFWAEGNHRGWSSICTEPKPSLELVLLTGGTQTGEHWVERCGYLLKILNCTEIVWSGHLFKIPVVYHSLPGPLPTWYPLFLTFHKWRKHPVLVLKPWLLMGPQSCRFGPHLTPATFICPCGDSANSPAWGAVCLLWVLDVFLSGLF